MVGSTISHYRILEKLGEGGMGVVYKAEDTKLDRLVALKFLPPHIAASEQDKARFIQEAKAAAALSHPNICTIYGIEDHDAQMFISMEFVDGQTLREKREAISFKQAIDIGIQIADGLAAAHEKGIVHRDIKPENIMIRKDGIAQIMDFGLAKLRSAGSRVTRLTKEGSTVGTAGYMSPEQIQGQDADHRSDIFSLGVLLYELLTGQLPFKGVHETALAYEIVNVDAPPLSSVRPDIDPNLDAIVLECLEKDQNERTQSAKQVAVDLKRYRRESSRQKASRVTAVRPVMSTAGSEPFPVRVAPAMPRFPRRELIAWCAVGVLVAVAGFLLISRPESSSAGNMLIRSSIVIPDSVYIHSFGTQLGAPVISPDGRTFAFSGVTRDGTKRIYVHTLDGTETRALPETEGGFEPFWAPDGKVVGFFSGGKMRKVDLVGGSPTTIADVPNPRGATWNQDGMIVFAPDFQSGLFRVSSDGKGTIEQVTLLDSLRHEGSHRWPCFLPDGKHVLYLSRAASETGEAEGDAVYVASLDGSTKKMLVQSSFNPSYADGYLLFARSSLLLAQRFDPDVLSLEGDPIKLQEGVLTDAGYNMAVYTVSRSGTLLFQSGHGEAGARPIFIDRTGKVVRVIDDRSEQDQPRFSPDGTQVALYIYDLRSRRSNIWVYDLRTGGRRRLSTRSQGDFYPCWSSDGTRIFFTSGGPTAADIYQLQVARTGQEKFFLDLSSVDQVDDRSPDGKTLLVSTFSPALNTGDLWLVPAVSGTGQPVSFQQTKFDERSGRISRDGKWVAYVSDESGEDEVYVKPFSDPAADAWKISSGGGDVPTWGARDEVIYLNPKQELVSATLRFRNKTGEVVATKPLFHPPPFSASYDISPDGKTFVITRDLEMQKFPPLSLVVHWEEALRRN